MKRLDFKKQKGFTLIELVSVIIVSSVLGASALPKFTDLADEAKSVVRLNNLSHIRSSFEKTYAKKSFYTPTNPYTSLENLIRKDELIDVVEYIQITVYAYDNNNGYLPIANDFSGVCVGIGRKVGTYTDKFGISQTTKVVDIVKYIDNYITPDALNCPSTLPNIQ